MSSSKMLVNLILGIALASGTLYLNRNPDFIKRLSHVAKKPSPADAVLASMDAPTDSTAPSAPLDAETAAADHGVREALAETDPTFAKKVAVPSDVRDTMKAISRLQRRAEDGLTGNETQDRMLKSLEDDELNTGEIVEGARSPASVVIEMDGTSAGVDPTAEERIMQLAVPESVRQQILENYRRTGILPAFEQKVAN